MHAILFTPRGMTSEQYNTVNDRLQEQYGEETPDGWISHVCYGEEGDLKVFEVWESREDQERFGEVLMPLIKEAGINLDTPPKTYPVVNFTGEDGLPRSERVAAGAIA